MAISHILAPNPIWYFADLTGRPLGSGFMYTYSSLNPTVQKAVYMDQAGLNAWTNPIRFRLNGSQGPFYWTVDTDNPDDLYYIEVYDVDNNLVYTIDDFSPPGSGGGSIITEARDLENLIINGQFYRNVGTSLLSPVPEISTIAPSAHAGFSGSIIYPDITFEKDAASTATDTLTIQEFTPLGIEALQDDVTGQFYAHYVCTNNPVGETKKDFNFPITAKVQNLSGTPVTFTVWAKVNSGANTISLYSYQFMGDGSGASPHVTNFIDSRILTNDWVRYTFQFTMNSVTGDSLGACGNDALYMKLRLPTGLACDIDITKPCLYVGSISPDEDYHTYDQINAFINSPRTGDVRVSMNSFEPFGWVPMNDGTIGDDGSNATTRANQDTFPLYNLIWNAMQASQSYAPMYSSAGALVAYTDPITDFEAGNQISLTKSLGQVFAGTSNNIPSAQTYTVNIGASTSILTVTNSVEFGTATPVVLQNSGGGAPTGLTVNIVYYAIYVSATTMRLATSIANALNGVFVTFSSNGSGTNTIQVLGNVLGLAKGEETHTMTIAEMPSHNHQLTPYTDALAGSGSSVRAFISSGSLTTTSTGGGTAFNIMQPTTYMNIFIKL